MPRFGGSQKERRIKREIKKYLAKVTAEEKQ